MSEALETTGKSSSRTKTVQFSERDPVFRVLFGGSPAGGGFSTLADLSRFERALRAGVLVSPAMLETLWQRRSDVMGGYGYGFAVGAVQGKRVIGHNGLTAGCSAVFDLYPDLGYTVAVLSNRDAPAAHRVAIHLRGVIGAAASTP